MEPGDFNHGHAPMVPFRPKRVVNGASLKPFQASTGPLALNYFRKQ
jgi:hypothetical protein